MTTMSSSKRVCVQVEDAGEAVKRFQGQGCVLQSESSDSAYLDCVKKGIYYDYETARDEVWPETDQTLADPTLAFVPVKEHFC